MKSVQPKNPSKIEPREAKLILLANHVASTLSFKITPKMAKSMADKVIFNNYYADQQKLEEEMNSLLLMDFEYYKMPTKMEILIRIFDHALFNLLPMEDWYKRYMNEVFENHKKMYELRAFNSQQFLKRFFKKRNSGPWQRTYPNGESKKAWLFQQYSELLRYNQITYKFNLDQEINIRVLNFKNDRL